MLCLILIVGGLLIMMGQHDRSEALFYYFRLEDQVPETHLLRLIERHISFAFVRERLKQSYSETGRPSIDPELLLQITNWLAWFAGIAIEAQQSTTALVEFLIEKTKLLDRLRGKLNSRQEKALVRMFREGPQGFKGGLSAGNYSTITGASPATTTRDLADLVEKAALTRTWERKHARYQVAVPLRETSRVSLNERGDLVES